MFDIKKNDHFSEQLVKSKINKDGTLTPLLKGRADKAIEFGQKQYETTKKKIIYVFK